MNLAVAQRITLAHHVKGGMEVHADALTRGLVARGHQVTVLTTAHPQHLPVERVGSLETRYLPRSDCRRYTRRWWRDSSRQLAALAAAGRADVLLSHSAGAIGYADDAVRAIGVPLVLVVHAPFAASLHNQWRAARTWRGVVRLAYDLAVAPRHALLWRRALGLASAVVAPSEEVAAGVRGSAAATSRRVTVIPHGVDTFRFAPAPEARLRVRRRLGLSPEAFVAVLAARLVPEKGIDVALRAAVHAPDVSLVIAGEGARAGALAVMARALGIAERVRFLGRVAHEAMPECLAAGDVFVLASRCREGLPVSLLEAMASGLPVVATSRGGQASAVAPGRTGVLVSPGDAAALAAALSRLGADPELRRSMSAAARREACARFDVEAMVRAYEEVLTRATGGSTAATGTCA